MTDRRIHTPVTLERSRLNTRYFHPGRRRLAAGLTATETKLTRAGVELDSELADLAFATAKNEASTALRLGERVTTVVWCTLPEKPRTFEGGEVFEHGHPRYLAYGASVFTKDRVDEEWVRKQHRATATGRLLTVPVVIKFDDLAVEAEENGSSTWALRLRAVEFVDGRTKDPADEALIAEAIRNFLLPKYGTDKTSKAYRHRTTRALALEAQTAYAVANITEILTAMENQEAGA